ncbi:WbqC family protein [Membranihabitans marinus]|uniref:WbqC family protein n=1 Tax=Membranihabitans marinus TaxID=1227546 RepID=UPI001F39F6A7|nr:WbqC family protein [Membranihabitans marinus]
MSERLIELQFAPSLLYFLLLKETTFIEAHENYNKRSFRNKCYIKGNRGSQWIILPLVKGKNRLPIQEVAISYEHRYISSIKHSLQTEYGSAPYYMHYIDDIMNILDRNHQYLYDLNLDILSYLCKQLDVSMPQQTTEYEHQPNQKVDYRDQIKPQLMDKNPRLLEEHEVEFYHFVPGHSILEVLFNYGPASANIIQRLTLSEFIGE